MGLCESWISSLVALLSKLVDSGLHNTRFKLRLVLLESVLCDGKMVEYGGRGILKRVEAINYLIIWKIFQDRLTGVV